MGKSNKNVHNTEVFATIKKIFRWDTIGSFNHLFNPKFLRVANIQIYCPGSSQVDHFSHLFGHIYETPFDNKPGLFAALLLNL